jgi:hypothetical protein
VDPVSLCQRLHRILHAYYGGAIVGFDEHRILAVEQRQASKLRSMEHWEQAQERQPVQ